MGYSKGQNATAQSSTEAEVCSMDTGVKGHGEPMLIMLQTLLGAFRHLEKSKVC